MICWRCGDEEATQIRWFGQNSLSQKNVCFTCAKRFDAEQKGDATMEFLIKVTAPDSLRQKDIVEDLRSALNYHANSGNSRDPYFHALHRVKLSVVTPKRTVKKLNRPIRKGGEGQ